MDKQKIEVLACPACGAPAHVQSATQDLAQPIHCEFCETVYTLRQSQDDAQKLIDVAQKVLQEHRTLLEQIAARSSASGPSGTDSDARHFIFNEKLYVSLKREVDQLLDGIENAFEAPMIAIKALMGLRDYQQYPLLLTLAQRDSRWVKLSSVRVSIQQLEDFAVTPPDKLKLRDLQFRLSNVVYLANIAQHFLPDVSSYRVVRQNLLALQQDYQKHAQDITDAAYRSYLTLLATRMGAGILLLDLLISVTDEGRNLVPEDVLARLDHILARFREVQAQALKCSYSSLFTVPLQQGIQKDLLVVGILQAALESYKLAAQAQVVGFAAFYEQLMHYVCGFTTIRSADQLLWLLRSVGRFLAARANAWPLPVLMDWNWLDLTIESGRHTSFYGLVREDRQVLLRYLHPYWVAKLEYSEEVNTISGKKGVLREGFMLVDAASLEKPFVVPLQVHDPSLPAVQAGLRSVQLLEKQVLSLPALLSRETALNAMNDHKRHHEHELRVARLELIGVVYLPAAYVRYSSKKAQRDIIVGCVDGINQQIGNRLLQTQKFLRQFAL